MNEYLANQISSVAIFPIKDGSLNGQFRVKFTSGTDAHNKRQTNWLNLTAEQFAAIEHLAYSHPAFVMEAVE